MSCDVIISTAALPHLVRHFAIIHTTAMVISNFRVQIIISKQLSDDVKDYHRDNHRLMRVRLQARMFYVTIMQV